jgi:hypothetical protein
LARRCLARSCGLEGNPQPQARRCGEPFEGARRRLHPAAFEPRDYRLRRLYALGQLLLRIPDLKVSAGVLM